MKKYSKEIYPKENNILQLPLFNFSKSKLQETTTGWLDENDNICSLECHCNYGVPGSFESDVYTATMRIWFKQRMPKGGLEVSYRDIAEELGLYPARNWVTHIKKSLEKLGLARYVFRKCFIKCNVKERITVQFSLFSSTYLFDRKDSNTSKGKSKLIFPDEIRDNLEAKYYQLLDMNIYRSLPSGLSRRLYEYLVKRKHHRANNIFKISEENICKWLPIKDKNTTKRRQKIDKISSHLIEIGFLKDYKFEKKGSTCLFFFPSKKESDQDKIKLVKQEDLTAGDLFCELTEWLDSIKEFNQARKQEILKLEKQHTLEVYPAIRKRFEENPGKYDVKWLYKAFKERWTFTEKKKTLETPEEKKFNECREAYKRMNEKEQKQFIDNLRAYMGETLSGQELEDFLASDKIWGTWGQMLMKEHNIEFVN